MASTDFSSMNSSGKQPLRVSPMRVLYVIGFFAIVLYFILNMTNHLMGRALLVAFGDTETVYQSAWVSWNGDITAKNIVVYPYEDWGDEDTPKIQFERARLETPGLHWVLFKSLTSVKFGKFDRRKDRNTPHLDRLHLTLTGVRSDEGFDPSLGDLGPFGAISASPYETEGCRHDTLWLRDELQAMGLALGPGTLSFDYQIENNQLNTTVSLSTPGAGEVTLHRQEQLTSGPRNALMIDQTHGAWQNERWRLRDLGFVAARNAHCANQESISKDAFVQRHLDSVERLLAVQGIGIDSATRRRYAQFARDGGELSLQVTYTPAISTDYEDPDQRSDDLLRAARFSIGSEQSLLPVALQQFSPQPLAGLDDGDLSTYGALEAERQRNSERLAELARPLGSLAQAAAAQARSAQADAPAEPPMAVALSVRSPDVAAEEVEQSASLQPAASAKIVSSQPPNHKLVTIGGGKGRHQQHALSWQDLHQHVGQPIKIWTRQGGARTVELRAVEADRLRVEARVGGGTGQYSVLKHSLIRAEAIGRG